MTTITTTMFFEHQKAIYISAVIEIIFLEIKYKYLMKNVLLAAKFKY